MKMIHENSRQSFAGDFFFFEFIFKEYFEI